MRLARTAVPDGDRLRDHVGAALDDRRMHEEVRRPRWRRARARGAGRPNSDSADPRRASMRACARELCIERRADVAKRDRQLARARAASRRRACAGPFRRAGGPTATQCSASSALAPRAKGVSPTGRSRGPCAASAPRANAAPLPGGRRCDRPRRASGAPRGFRGQIFVEIGAREDHGEVPRAACASWKRAIEAALRRACSAIIASQRSPFHSRLYNDPEAIAQHARPTARRCASCRCSHSLVPGVTMQTTGLAAETIRGLYEGERLDHALVRCARPHARRSTGTWTWMR